MSRTGMRMRSVYRSSEGRGEEEVGTIAETHDIQLVVCVVFIYSYFHQDAENAIFFSQVARHSEAKLSLTEESEVT